MEIKEIWFSAMNWLTARKQYLQKLLAGIDYAPEVDREGLINVAGGHSQVEAQTLVEEMPAQSSQVIVKPVQQMDKTLSVEKLQDGFNKLVYQLQDINAHLDHQISQHEDIVNRLDKMPKLLETFPAILDQQRQMTQQLMEQLKVMSLKNQQFVDAVERIPTETAKQTDALVDIDHQLAASADTDVQMAENFNKFNEVLLKLDKSTNGQTESITQMNRTFATSDRYLKYLIAKQNKRFTWIFGVAMGVCLFAILVLAGLIIYLRR
jgi:hypothetical protein